MDEKKIEAQIRIEGDFPNLKKTPYKITSKIDPQYNCIAWAANDINNWWEPVTKAQLEKYKNFCSPEEFARISSKSFYWPEGVKCERTIEAYIDAYRKLGFQVCSDGTFEQGYKKIAIYVDSNGKPTHASKLLKRNKWSSKLGETEDIEHTLEGLHNGIYGVEAVFMKCPNDNP